MAYHRKDHFKISAAVAVFLFFGHLVPAQELIENEFEKGYVKDGKKYSVWDYFDEDKTLELKINHTTGRVFYIKPDTTDYAIYRDGKWVNSKLAIYPVPITGYQNFYRSIKKNLRFPAEARRNGIEGEVIVLFEIDSTGRAINYSIARDIGGGYGDEVIRVLNEIATPWLTAQSGKDRYLSRFALPVAFGLGGPPKTRKRPKLPLAKELEQVMIIAYGIDRPPPR